MALIYDDTVPETLGYYWHRDKKKGVGDHIIEIVRDQGTNAIIVFDGRDPLKTISTYAYGGEFAGPIEKPENP